MTDAPKPAVDETAPEQTPDEQSREKQSAEQEQAPTPGAAAPRAEAHDDGSDAGVELKEDLDELGALAAKRDEYLALAQRTQADFENYRKRVARESVLAQERGVAKLAKELLPAIDNLDRALAAAATDEPVARRRAPRALGIERRAGATRRRVLLAAR